MKPIPHLQFRTATAADTVRILEIIRQAQAQMRALGSSQWQDGYPAPQDIERDIERGRGVVALSGWAHCDESRHRPTNGAAAEKGTSKTIGYSAEVQNKIAGDSSCAPNHPKNNGSSVIAYAAVFFDDEPAYDVIDGAWIGNSPYVVVHRLAVADEAKGQGVATAFMRHTEETAKARGFGSFRIDTACDNRYMQRMLRTLGFTCCGRIRYRSGERLAYEKMLDNRSSDSNSKTNRP